MSRDVKFLSQTSRVQNIFRKILKFDPAQNYSQCLLSLTNKHTRRLVQTTKDHTIAPKIWYHLSGATAFLTRAGLAYKQWVQVQEYKRAPKSFDMSKIPEN